MAVDEALLYGRREGDLPILRLYAWTPSLSLGRYSKTQEGVMIARLAETGMTAVRRITGGGILVHGGDLSYALIVPRSFVDGRGVKENYRFLCGFLIRLYARLGLEAAFAHELQLDETHSPLCLAGREAYDIVIAGNKVGGNAQRYTRHALLQHGSIPLRLEPGRFEPLFCAPSGLENAASLERLGIHLTEKALKEELVGAFCDAFATEVSADGLRPEEEAIAQTLQQRKYEQEAWNVHAKDPFSQA
jgi:lipoate-protein ligase A